MNTVKVHKLISRHYALMAAAAEARDAGDRKALVKLQGEPDRLWTLNQINAEIDSTLAELRSARLA